MTRFWMAMFWYVASMGFFWACSHVAPTTLANRVIEIVFGLLGLFAFCIFTVVTVDHSKSPVRR